MNNKTFRKLIMTLMLTSLSVTALIGCGRQNDTSEAVDPVESLEIDSKTEAESVRKDGERFEEVIMLEGMEETVKYEHVRNDSIGFEIDYDYESFVRCSEPDRERFISIYDDLEKPENYLELIYREGNADTVSTSVGDDLSNDYDIIREQSFLDHAGSCIRIDASSAKGGGTSDQLQMVYIIPAGDGCIIATAHYSFESAEGFGRRFAYIMNTLEVVDGN